MADEQGLGSLSHKKHNWLCRVFKMLCFEAIHQEFLVVVNNEK